MDAITLPAHFDGEQIVLDQPFELKPDTKLLVTVLPEEELGDEREAWLFHSMSHLAKAYGEDEAEYSIDLIKEPNPEYEGR